jgi:hypothetical protein
LKLAAVVAVEPVLGSHPQIANAVLLDGGDVGISEALDVFAKTVPLSRRSGANRDEQGERNRRAPEQPIRFEYPIHQARSFSALGKDEIGGESLKEDVQMSSEKPTWILDQNLLALQ